MIIQCQACRARFKLDESKIKGKGARIRCRKCGESIIVMRSEIPPAVPSQPGKVSSPGKEFFDLRAELRTPEKPAPETPQQEVGLAVESPAFREAVSQPGPSLEAKQPEPPSRGEREVFAPEPVEPPAPPPPDTVDDTVERLVHGHGEREPEKIVPYAEAFHSGPADAGADIESPLFREREEQPAQPADAGADIESPLSREREEQPAQPADAGADIESPLSREREEQPAQPAEPDEPPSPPDLPDAPFTLELETEEDLSFLREAGEQSAWIPKDATRAENSIAPPPEGAGSESDRESAEYLVLDTDSTDSLRREEPPPVPPAKFDISDILEHDTPSRAESLQDELAGLSRERPMERISVPEPQSPVLPPPKPLETAEKRDVRRRAPASSGRPSVALLVLLFVMLAGAGAYLAFTKTGQETLRTIIPGLESFWLGGKGSGRPFLVGNLTADFESGASTGRLFVIRGDVTNQGRKPKSAIRIRAELLDANRRPIAEQTAYGGNVIPDLRSADRKTIDDAMANRFGDTLSNVDVSPGKSLPFMVVFFDPPEGIAEYRLEALEGQ